MDEDRGRRTKPIDAPRAAPARLQARNPVLIATLIFSGVFGLGCIYGGIQFMRAGETVFDFVGLQFSGELAGPVVIALGAVTISLTIRKVLVAIGAEQYLPPPFSGW
jgi:hypothetical protein